MAISLSVVIACRPISYLKKDIATSSKTLTANSYFSWLYKIRPLLSAALKEAIAKIETLETKVAALEAA